MAPSSLATAPAWLRRLWCLVRLAYISAKANVKAACRWPRTGGYQSYGDRGSGHGPEAYRVYVFNEGGGEGFHRELSVRNFHMDSWEQDTRALTGWDSFRVEVRYMFRHKKYRMVLRPGDACAFPPLPEPSAPACRLPQGVLSARLQGPKGSDIDSDVTLRVLKYQGPKGDFHTGLGLRVRLKDMFPFDDHCDNAARFSHLRIVDTTARIADLPYAPNPRMSHALGLHRWRGLDPQAIMRALHS
jgi:hypothetical protein